MGCNDETADKVNENVQEHPDNSTNMGTCTSILLGSWQFQHCIGGNEICRVEPCL